MLEQVKDYYGKTLQQSSDLKTDACCTLDAPPPRIAGILKNIHGEVASRYYGCGLVAPELLQGLSILDLGCGSGRDVYVLSALTGETGQVVGVDMTEEQLAVASEYRHYHANQFGYSKPNTDFKLGYIEKLDELGFADNSFDLIVSNCVINLSPDKASVLREAYRILKPGGELYFSDVYADRRIPTSLAEDPVLYGECLSGALYWNDFLTLAKNQGFTDARLIEDRPLGIENEDIQILVNDISFYSATYRLFKIEQLEPCQEDYGQQVTYLGSIEEQVDCYTLDKNNIFKRGEKTCISGNTWKILQQSRLKNHFDFDGDFSAHQGIDKTDPGALPFDKSTCGEKTSGGCC